MKTYTVHVHLEGTGENAEAVKHDKTFEVTGGDVDDVRAKTIELLKTRGLPAVRSLNFHDTTIIAFCGEHPQRVEANTPERVHPMWKRPPGAPRL